MPSLRLYSPDIALATLLSLASFSASSQMPKTESIRQTTQAIHASGGGKLAPALLFASSSLLSTLLFSEFLSYCKICGYER
jgi:hypothetical protein